MMNKKIESLKGLILEDASLGMDLVNEINGWDGSLEYLQAYSMDEFDEIMNGFEPSEIANRIYFGDFNPNHEYFRFDVYANLESLDEYEMEEEIKDYASEIAERTVKLYEEGRLNYLQDEVLEILEDQEEEE